MAPPDVLKCRTQAFFQFSPGKEERKLGSELLTFRRKKKRAMAVESLLGIPTALFINVEARGQNRFLFFFFNPLFLTHPHPPFPEPCQEFCSEVCGFPVRERAGVGGGGILLLPPGTARGGSWAGPRFRGPGGGTQPVPEPGQ